MVDYKYADLFLQSNIDRQIRIETDSGTLTNKELFWENLEINESLCSENELRFGSCEASQIKFKVAYRVIPMINKEITVTEILEGAEDNPFQFGKYKVQSDKPTADRQWRDIVAYDAMYDIINAEVSGWYNTLLPNDNSTVTMRKFRKSFLEHFGIEEDDPSQVLVNDSMTVQKTVQPTSISGKDVITAICEINACFGHIGRNGKFKYIYLPQNIQGLYPADDLYPDHAPDYLIAQQEAGHLYPQDPKGTAISKGQYKSCHYEDYLVRPINKLQIRQNENEIGKVWPEEELKPTDNCYIIEDNFLVYGKNDSELREIAKNIYSKITYIIYRPFDAVCVGNPCFEVGDPVRLSTQYELVESYILERTLKGIQAPMDTYRSNGTEVYSEQVNSVNKSIIQLKGKTNELTRTVDETRSELRDTADGLDSKIVQTAGEIRAEVNKADEALSARITLNADSITSEVSRAKGAENELSSKITQTATEIRAEVKNTADGLSSTISQTASEIRSEVKNTTDSLSSRITQNANEIDLRVTKSGVISAINLTPETVTIQAQKIDLVGLVNADELVSKFATIVTLNATKANLEDLIATKATIESLNSVNANLTNLISQKASITDLNATNARVGTLETDRITASQVESTYATITDLNGVNAKFNNLNANNITSGTISVDRLNVSEIVGAFSTFNIFTSGVNTGSLYVSNNFSFTGLNVGVYSKSFTDGDGKTVSFSYLGFT